MECVFHIEVIGILNRKDFLAKSIDTILYVKTERKQNIKYIDLSQKLLSLILLDYHRLIIKMKTQVITR